MVNHSVEKEAREWIKIHHPNKENTAVADLLVAAFVAGRAVRS